MKKYSMVLLVGAVLLFLNACTTAQFSGLQMSKEAPSYTALGDFETTVSVTQLLGGAGGVHLVNMTADAMDPVAYDAIQAEIEKLGGDAAVNITIKQHAEVIDLLISSITGYIYSPSKLTITGTVVQY